MTHHAKARVDHMYVLTDAAAAPQLARMSQLNSLAHPPPASQHLRSCNRSGHCAKSVTINSTNSTQNPTPTATTTPTPAVAQAVAAPTGTLARTFHQQPSRLSIHPFSILLLYLAAPSLLPLPPPHAISPSTRLHFLAYASVHLDFTDKLHE
jgi:hypothetical protein